MLGTGRDAESAYHLSCSCAAVLDSQGERCQQSLSLFVSAECGSARQNAEGDDSKMSMTLISRLVILKK